MVMFQILLDGAEPLSSTLKIIKINGGIESVLCMTKARSTLLDSRQRTTLPWRTPASSSCVINENPVMRGSASLPRTSGSHVDIS